MNYETDEDNIFENEEDMLNENPLPEIDNEFRKLVLDIKHKLYNSIIFSGKEGTHNSQNNKLMDDYLNKLNRIYIYTIQFQNKNNISKVDLNQFPESVREPIQQLLEWIKTFFNKNNMVDTIPYSCYLKNNFYEYPYVQTDNFSEFDN